MKLYDRFLAKAVSIYLARTKDATIGTETHSLDEAFMRAFSDWIKSGYSVNEYIGAVFNCIDVWGLYFAKAKFRVYKETSQGSEELLDTVYNKMFKKPNSYQTWWEQKHKIAGHFGLFGNSYFYKLRNKFNKEVFALQQLIPKNVERIRKNGEFLSGYKYMNGTEEIFIPKDDIIDLRYPDPTSDMEGVPIASTVLDTQKLAYLQNQYMLKFYENGGFLGQVFTTKAQLKTKEFNDLQQRLREEYTGIENAGKLAIFDNDMQPVKTAYSPKDIDMSSLKKITKDDIYEAWKVSKIHVGSGELVNRASNDASIYQFTSGVIDPILDYIDDVFSSNIRLDLKNDYLYIKHDTLAPKDIESSLKYYESGLHNGWLSVNEVRKMEDWNGVVGKLVDSYLINGGGALYDVSDGTRIDTPEVMNEPNNQQQEPAKKEEPKSFTKSNTSDEYKKLRYKQFERNYLTAERRFNRKIDDYFDSQERRILEAVKDNFIVGEVFAKEIDNENWLLYQLLEIEIFSIMVEGSRWGSRLHQTDVISPTELKDALKSTYDRIQDNAKLINFTTLEKFKEFAPADVEEAKNVIGSTYKDIEPRSTALVRSTALGSFNAGLLESMRNAGIEQKMWLSMRDDRVRHKLSAENHVHMDGITVPIDSLFDVPARKGSDMMMYPADPFASPENVINCRCTIIGE